MKKLYIIFFFVSITIYTGNTQGCDPAINGFSFSIADCLDDENATLTVEWGMSGVNPACVAPEGSFAIQINLPASGVYGVNDVSDVTGPSLFDWTLIDDFTLEGINNEDIDWLEEGDIEVTIRPLIVNGCALLLSNTNIQVFGSGPPFFGSPGSFDDDDNNNTQDDQLGVTALVPVELISFKAENLDCNHNGLEWSTGSEINNSGFEVQRSLDGKNFQEIGFVEALEDPNNGTRTYRFVDEKLSGQNLYYYRIKQIDYDGQFEIFDIKVVQVHCDSHLEFSLFPNPAVDELNIKLTGSTIQLLELAIHNMDGKLVSLIKDQNLEDVIDISDLDAGMYLLKIKTESEIIEENFIKLK